MIPILYEANETAFTSEGIGPLSDVLSCYVEEERNGGYELEMEYPVTGALFNELKTRRVILAKASDSGQWQPFDIYYISPNMDGVVTINAEHVSYRLSGIPVEPFEATGIASALNGLKAHSLISNPFDVWTDISNVESTFKVAQPQSFRACLAGTEGSILDTFSGSRSCEFEFDRFTVKVHAHRGQDNGVTIEYGKNLTDLEQEEDISECYTGVLAYWKDSQSENDSMIWSDIQYIENHASYPRERIYVLDASSDFDMDVTVTKELLNERAAEYAADNDIGRPSVNLTVSFINLAQTAEFADTAPIESVRLCDEVNVYFPLLGVDVTTQVIRTKFDCILERYEEIELGDVKNSFADTIKQNVNETLVKPVAENQSFLEKAFNDARNMLTGGYGGHIVPTFNANKQWNELFAIDTDDISTATKGLRLNANGLGSFTGGINGTYNVAITIDGSIVADRITTGTLRAIDIEGVHITGSVITFGTTGKTVTASSTDDGNGVVFDGEGEIRIQTKNSAFFRNYEQDGAMANNFTLAAHDGYGAGTNQLELYNYWDGKYANSMEFQSNDTYTEVYMLNEDNSHLRPNNAGWTGYENLIRMVSNRERKFVTLKNAMFNAPSTASTIEAWATADLEAVGLFNYCGKEKSVNQITARREDDNYYIGLYNSYNGDRQSNQLILRARGNTRNELLIRNLDFQNGGNFASSLDMYSSADGNLIDLANYYGGNRVSRIYFFNSGSLTLESTKIFDVNNRTRSVINSNITVDGGAVQLYNGRYMGSAVISTDVGSGRHAVTLGWDGSKLWLYVDATTIGYLNTSR